LTISQVSWCQGKVLSSSAVGIGDGLNIVLIWDEEAHRAMHSRVDDKGISF
jgi:hypothetical protein